MPLIVPSFGIRNSIQSLICHVGEFIDFATLHPTRQLRRHAIAETVDYIRTDMPKALSLYTSKDVLAYCLDQLDRPGLLLEFGVFKGGSIRYLASRCPDREIHGFDSFEGLPEEWPEAGHAKGAFSAQGRLPRVPANVKLHRGYFDSSLPQWLTRNDGDISFIHIDCDLYQSTKTIFDLLDERIKPGTIIAFDEYFGYPRWQQGEHRAFMEFVQRRRLQFEYMCHARYQVAVRILGVRVDRSTLTLQPRTPIGAKQDGSPFHDEPARTPVRRDHDHEQYEH